MKIAILFCLNISSLFIFGQTQDFTGGNTNYYEGNNIGEVDFFDQNNEILGVDGYTSVRKVYRNTDKHGLTHTKYNQYYKGFQVVGGTVVLHSENGVVKKATGNLPIINNLETIPSLTEVEAKEIAKIYIAKIKDDKVDSQIIEGIRATIDDICIVAYGSPKKSNYYRLAYPVLLTRDAGAQPLKYRFYIDAISGDNLLSYSEIQNISVPGIGRSVHYGDVDINTDSVSPGKFVLRDLNKGQGIFVNSAWESDFKFEDEDNVWEYEDEGDQSAIDAFYSTNAYYDFLLEQFGRNSIDDNGKSLICNVNEKAYVNAYWDGIEATFGAGDCYNYKPLTSMGVVGHEFTHGMIQYTAGLIYNKESGALNESISDIFGKALEYYKDNEDIDWLVGGKLPRKSYIKPFRSFKNPIGYEKPRYYKGRYWIYSIYLDGGGVHTNSSVMNHWFYLLVDGKSGQNEDWIPYDVQSIGMDNAIQLVYHLLVNYLTPFSDYQEAYLYSIEAAIDLFGEGSVELANVVEAWKAVGLPAQTQPSVTDSIDFLIRLNGDGVIVFCYEDVISLDIGFLNRGLGPIRQGTTAKLKVNAVAPFIEDMFFERELEEDVAVGDMITFTIDVDTSGLDTNYIAFLNEFTLHRDTMYYSYSQYGNLNLRNEQEAYFVNLNLDIFECEDDPRGDVRFVFSNHGCRRYSDTDSLRLVLYNDSQSKTVSIPVSSGYGGLSYFYGIEYYLDLNSIDNPEHYFMDIFYNETFVKTDTLRNYYHPVLQESEIIQFEGDTLESTINIVKEAIFMKQEIVDGQLFIESTLRRITINDCLDFDDYYRLTKEEDGFGYGFTEIEFCVDHSDMENPVLSFDLRLVDRTNVSPNENNYIHFLKVFQEDESLEIITSTQDSYETIEIELQKELASNIRFNLWLEGTGAYLDNIFIYNKMPIATQELEIANRFNITNPVSSEINIFSVGDQSKWDFELYDLNGTKVVSRMNIRGSLNEDVNFLPTGSYFYKISENATGVSYGKIIIVR